MKNNLILLTATKTGGHILPAIETGMAIRSLNPDWQVHMAVSGASIEKSLLKGVNFPVHVVRAGELKGMGRMKRVQNLLRLPGAGLSAIGLLRKLRPAVVAGFGGFTTGPVLSAAALMGIPTAILEANSIPGLTNRILGRIVNRVFISFEDTARYFAAAKVELTGTPIRREIAEVRKGKFTGPAKRILVFGGSQGARFLNETAPELLGRVAKEVPGLSVIHQTGKEIGRTAEAYKEKGIQASVSSYIRDMAGAYRWADFVISRSGAGTIAELMAVGMPSLLIPFPFAADDHQYYNALAMVQTGAAILVRQENFDVELTANRLAELFTSPERLNEAASAAAGLGKVKAANTIAKTLISMTREVI